MDKWTGLKVEIVSYGLSYLISKPKPSPFINPSRQYLLRIKEGTRRSEKATLIEVHGREHREEDQDIRNQRNRHFGAMSLRDRVSLIFLICCCVLFKLVPFRHPEPRWGKLDSRWSSWGQRDSWRSWDVHRRSYLLQALSRHVREDVLFLEVKSWQGIGINGFRWSTTSNQRSRMSYYKCRARNLRLQKPTVSEIDIGGCDG